MNEIKTFIAARRKAIVGAAVSGVTYFAAKHGFHLTTDETTALIAVLTGISVHFVPNSPA